MNTAASPARALTVAIVALAALLGGHLTLAHADAGDVAEFNLRAAVGRDGVLVVDQEMIFDTAAPAEVVQRIATVENSVGDDRFRYAVSDIIATADGAPIAVTVRESADAVTVTIPTDGVSGPVNLGYRVDGAVRETPDGTMLHWQFLQGLSAAVDNVEIVVDVPGTFSFIDCAAGPPNTSVQCVGASGGTSETSMLPTFIDGPRAPGEVVSVEIGFPPGLVTSTANIEQRWSVARGFSAAPLPLALGTALLILGGLTVWVLHRRAGADERSDRTEPVAEFIADGDGGVEFRVVGAVRPGEVGTLADETVDPIDVLATVLDLAVRGYLRVTELPHTSLYAPADWTFERRDADLSVLQPYELRLLDAVAPADGQPVKVSQMSQALDGVVPEVQSELYDEMVSNGWFEQRPDAIRNRWQRAAVIGLVASVAATAALAVFTSFGLIGLALVIVCVGLLFVAQEMPARTRKGAAALRGLDQLSDELHTRPTDDMRAGSELEVISRVLPYAVVLGGSGRWLDAIVATDDESVADAVELDWYHAPEDWRLTDLPDSLRHLTLTLAGVLFART